MCQDTGHCYSDRGKRARRKDGFFGQRGLSRGIHDAYVSDNFQIFTTGSSHPCIVRRTPETIFLLQIDIYAAQGNSYNFLFVAKGGGSSNKKRIFFRRQRLSLIRIRSIAFLADKMKTIGTAACPPYHLAFVVGGTSAEANLKTVKLASTGSLDNLPDTGNEQGRGLQGQKSLKPPC